MFLLTVLSRHIAMAALVIAALTLAGCATSPQPCVSDSNKFAVQLKTVGGQLMQVGDNVTIILPTDSCFEVGTARFTESCAPLLQGMAGVLKSYGDVPIRVVGYTDNVAGSEQAHMLSRAQAESVVAYLWTQGIPRQHISAIGRGADCPIANNATIEGSALNRRLEVTLRRA